MQWPLPAAGPSILTREIRVDFRRLGRVMKERPEAVILGLGVLLRLYAYLLNRGMWLDEMMLKGNIVNVRILDFWAPLTSDQLAPFGFLIVQRALATFVSERNYVLRFLPLMAGIGSLYLFSLLARRILPRRAALIALILVALSDDLIYYSSEMKPYSLDVAFGVAITLAACLALGQIPSARAVVWLAVLAATAPWFSFASAFMVAGCGIVLLLDALMARRLRTALLWTLIGLGWLANFLVSYRASQAMLSPYTTMYRFWDFAFLRLNEPMSRSNLLHAGGLLLEKFANPLNLVSIDMSRWLVLLPLIALVVGTVTLARRSPRALLLLASPIALALLAAGLRVYPFHGRLILELVPAFFLIIAQGIERLAARPPDRSGLASKFILLVFLAYPCWSACSNAVSKRIRDFNRHGDLHPNVFIDIPDKPRRQTSVKNAGDV
jgi:uncharacterized membrane protein